MIRRLTRILLRTIIGILIFVIGYLGTAYVLSRIAIQKEKNTKEEISIYILTNGVHTDLVLPLNSPIINWNKYIIHPDVNPDDSSFQYLAFGWGDKGFYLETPTWSELKFSVAFKAAFGLSQSAMHTTFYKEMSIGENCKEIKIMIEQYLRLVNYIKESFEKDIDGRQIKIKINFPSKKIDSFYEAIGTYHLFYTCNTWANNGLKICGQKACVWTIFEKGIFLKYE